MRKSVVVIVSLLIMLIANTALAFQLNQPEYLGWYDNSRAGGPYKAHAKGYTQATKDTFVFGSGEEALIFQYQNRYYKGGCSSETKAVYVGKHLIPIRTGGFPAIYRITSQDGRTFYIGVGTGAGLSQEFYLIGKCEDSYWNAITAESLENFIEIYNINQNFSKLLGKPYTQGDKIILPYYIRNNPDQVAGRFVFTWDPQVKWFGITLE